MTEYQTQTQRLKSIRPKRKGSRESDPNAKAQENGPKGFGIGGLGTQTGLTALGVTKAAPAGGAASTLGSQGVPESEAKTVPPEATKVPAAASKPAFDKYTRVGYMHASYSTVAMLCHMNPKPHMSKQEMYLN
ncbi:hypothetical protein SARC_14394 [Sphaeroforma arctica JP610]|uniref:Uncharacterized protein n=1 Tax=Sphaeroforma arctica JP610 TaxID=667725 RepID=A0A0L0F8K3_9EUKA|nr:hypothetical protein SARC_14394 [Sphaeroforma arctica JP610]KNC73045.1 hypothetical protein SARC_14394 [Sphaeroforma arctica JP610]|eukprot:XP_014146947.1 hypothetical protein SARC_14394 [Sphaeroforma arctica JP610]